MSELGGDFRAMKEHRQKRGRVNRAKSSSSYIQAARLASEHGMTLTKHSESHYALAAGPALYNIYPGNQRIYVDDAHRQYSRYLLRHLKKPYWTLVDVVRAVLDAHK